MAEPSQKQIDNLLAKAIDQRLDENEIPRFEQLLLENSDARDIYLNLAVLSSYLEIDCQTRDMLVQVIGELDAAEETEAAAKADLSSPRRRLGSAADAIHWRRHPARFLTVVLLLTVMGWLGLFAVMRPGLDEERPMAVVPQIDEVLPAVARLSGTRDCQWASAGRRLQLGQVVRKGQRFELLSGVAKFTYRSGTELLVEGPAKFTFRDEGDVSFDVGRLVAFVPRQAIGFSVHTSVAVITDLGTRFAVAVDPQGKTAAHVFEGMIELAAHGRTYVLTAGSAMYVDGQKTAMADADPKSFREIVTYSTGTAAIVWSDARDFMGPSDILGEGRLVLAINGGTAGSMVHGVKFKPERLLGRVARGGLAGHTTGDEALDKLLDEFTYGGGETTLFALKGLMPGKTYKVQLIYCDGRQGPSSKPSPANRPMIYGDGHHPQNTVCLNNNVVTSDDGPFGQYAIGTFVAEQSAQTITIRTAGAPNAHLSAVVVREARAEEEGAGSGEYRTRRLLVPKPKLGNQEKNTKATLRP